MKPLEWTYFWFWSHLGGKLFWTRPSSWCHIVLNIFWLPTWFSALVSTMGAWALTIDITIGPQYTPMPRRASNNFENLSVHNSAHSGRLCFHSGRYNGRSVSAYWLHHMLQFASKIIKYSNYLVHRDRKKPIENKRPLSVHCSARCYKHKRPLWMLQWTLMISYIGSIRGLGKAMKT